MKRMRLLIAIFALSAPITAGAEPINVEANSNAFTFPAPAALTTGVIVSPATLKAISAFQCRAETHAGITMLSYTPIPSSLRNVKMSIFNLAGAQVASFDLKPGSSSVQWSVEKHSVAAGVYWSSIRFGSVEKKIKISIVK
jgi:hypothetical protein